jgi:hypothetical protein
MSGRIDDLWTKQKVRAKWTSKTNRKEGLPSVSNSSHDFLIPGNTGALPQTPEFIAYRPGLALTFEMDRRELTPPLNPGCRLGARVALQRCPIPDRVARSVSENENSLVVQ